MAGRHTGRRAVIGFVLLSFVAGAVIESAAAGAILGVSALLLVALVLDLRGWVRD